MAACQRNIISCSRCRKRKIKCDRQLPSCSQCLNAKTACTGISPSSQSIPRSIVQSLEGEISALKSRLGLSGDDLSPALLPRPPGTASQPNHIGRRCPPPENALRASILSSRFMQGMVSATTPYADSATNLLSKVRLGMTPSSVQVSGRVGETIRHAGRGQSCLGATVLRGIPIEVLQHLVRKYLLTIHCHSPFLDATTLDLHLQYVAQTLSPNNITMDVAPSYEFLVIYLVAAISITLGVAGGGHEARCTSLSVSLFEEGIRHLYSLPTFPSNLAWIQTILLILCYATIQPRSANVWILSGAAMRACVAQGLHREAPSFLGLSEGERDLRRRAFWASYCIDRGICSALQRPLSTPDATISVQMPQIKENETAFLGSIQYNRLMSEIVHAHYEGGMLPDGYDWDMWLVQMGSKLSRWHDTYSRDTRYYESADFCLARAMMVLHRPSPRMPMPNDHSLVLAFESAAKSARIHREYIQSGVLRRPWLAAHFTLEAATIILFGLRHGYAPIRAKFKPAEILDMTKLLTTNFILIADQGWPEVMNYAGIYERLLGALLDSVLSTTPMEKFTPAQDTELTRLLYPGPADMEKLRSGRAAQDAPPSVVGEAEDYDFLSFLFPELSDDPGAWDVFIAPGGMSHELEMGVSMGFMCCM
ncbi:fungal-specific transcription factor domain-containing protein [Xylariales sp. PMI_506]|nr:fungal-specific transcription factor domain-containing protein [Xylariales sp. PMI_506]